MWIIKKDITIKALEMDLFWKGEFQRRALEWKRDGVNAIALMMSEQIQQRRLTPSLSRALLSLNPLFAEQRFYRLRPARVCQLLLPRRAVRDP